MDDHLPVINLELSSGSFKIRTPDAVYHITVTADSSVARVVEKVVEKEAAPPPKVDDDDDDLYYQEITEEMYREIGKLARQLSLSIKEIPGQLREFNIEQTGVELESAKGQLEDIVQMTEKATMDIMDLAETIQEDLQSVETQLTALTQLDFMSQDSEAAEEDDWGTDIDEGDIEDIDESVAAHQSARTEAFQKTISEVLAQEQRLREAVSELPVAADHVPAAPEPAPEPRTETVTTYSFDVDVVFQTLYELCTNETVKEHIKAMRADQESAFDQAAIKKALADQAPTVEVEDEFYNFSITSVLKSLFAATSNDKYKATLKKMNKTAGEIFLDTILPIMGESQQEEVQIPAEAPEPEPVAAPNPGLPVEEIERLLAMIDDTIGRLNSEQERLQESEAVASQAGPTALEPGFTSVRTEDQQTIISAVEGSNEVVRRITTHITRILEALSFQDLSGQRIMKIVRLISDVQVHLLSLLVSYGAKIKKHQQAKQEDVSIEDTQKMAQEEVDKMLERVSTPTSELEGPDAEGRLNQDAVDGLLKDLGF
jgi:chemotaxis regulatin CheY-phosphate phosphatase CheZ